MYFGGEKRNEKKNNTQTHKEKCLAVHITAQKFGLTIVTIDGSKLLAEF